VDGTTYCCGVPVNVQAPMLYYRADLLPEDWQENWDEDQNGVPDMVENWNDLYAYSKERHEENPAQYGYMKSLYDVYFSSGFLFSYGGYVFGEENTNPEDVGFSAGEAEKGAWVLQQLAGVMNEECIDDTITTNAYSKLGDGTYFATLSTPDMYSTFADELEKEYEAEGMNEEEARETAKQNLIMTTLPKLPESGDLSESDPVLIDMKAMGGVNGYAARTPRRRMPAWHLLILRQAMRWSPDGARCSELHRRAAMRRRVRGTYRRKSMQISRTEMWC
jgi:arabinogalactan oligomer/maltooligosaccharide transport system substrate-binding protein